MAIIFKNFTNFQNIILPKSSDYYSFDPVYWIIAPLPVSPATPYMGIG